MRSASSYIVIFIIFISPALFGSNIALAWYLNAALVSLAVMALTGGALLYYVAIPVPFKKIRAPAILFALAFLWASFQAVPLISNSFFDFKFLLNPVWQLASGVLPQEVTGSISANREETLISLLRWITGAALFWLALQLSRTPERAKLLLYSILAAVTLYATYGLILHVIGSQTILWFPKEFYKESLTATFINRNSAATYFGLGCVVISGLLIRHFQKTAQGWRGWRHSISHLTYVIFEKKFLLLLYSFAICFSALLLTGSRAGIIATFFSLIVLLFVYLLKSRSSMGVILTLFGLFIALLLALSEVGGSLFAERLQVIAGNDSESRLNAYRITLSAIGDFLWVGTGLGTFSDIFPLYRNESLSTVLTWDKAHNTYIELMLELGIPAALMMITSIFLLVARTFKGFLERRQSSHYCAIGFATSILVGSHALVDFSIQIQAITLLYCVILGLAVGQSWSGKTQNL